MKKFLLIPLLIVLFSCASKNAPLVHSGTVVKTWVTQKPNKAYSTLLDDTTTTFNFILPTLEDPNLNTSMTSVVQFCSDAAQAKGYTVGINLPSCERCLHVNVANSDAQAIKTSLSTGCFLDQPDCVGGQTTLHQRVIQLTFKDPLTQAVADFVEVRSEGAHDSVAQVSREMCHAVFLEFPKAMNNKDYKIRYSLAR